MNKFRIITRMKKWQLLILVFVILLGLLVQTNPNERDYYEFTVKQYGESHLGIMGKFIQISDGQFDYPVWLELLK